MNKKEFYLNPGEGRHVWGWAVPFLGFIFIMAGQIAGLVPAVSTGLIDPEQIETYPSILYMLFVIFGVIMVPLWLWLKYYEQRPLSSIGMTTYKGRAKHCLQGYGIGLFMAVVSVFSVWMVGGYGVDVSATWAPSLVPIALLMLGFLVQSSVEEIVFRGWMLSRVSASYGLWAGVLVNSLVFTLMHLNVSGEEAFDPFYFVIFVSMTMAFSIFTSFLVIRQKSVWGACAWHAAWNWSFITWFGLPTTGITLNVSPLLVDLANNEQMPSWLTGGSVGPENSVITAVVLFVACFLAYPKKEMQRH